MSFLRYEECLLFFTNIAWCQFLYQWGLIFSVYNNSRIIFKKKRMSEYNIVQMKDLDTYGEHLFYLDNKCISFFTEQSQEGKHPIETKFTTSDRSTNQNTSKIQQPPSPCTDDHFQMSFMNEHELIVKKYIKNYMELLHNNKDDHQNCITYSPQSGDVHDTLEQTLETIKETSQDLNKGEILRITNEILKHEKLASFLRIIALEYNSNLALTLLKITCQIWQEYSKSHSAKLMEREIIEQVSRMLSSSFLKKITHFLPVTLKGCQFSKLKCFLNVFANTILFVANEYFLNPYYQLEEDLLVQEFQNYELYLYDSNVFEDDSEEEEDLDMFIKGRKLIKRQTSF